MAQSFSLGLRQVWEDLSVMQSPGFYWVNSNRQSDAQLFCQQVIAAQQEDSRAALICCGSKPEKLMAGIKAPALKKLPLYTLPEKKAALLSLPDDLMRALNPSHRLLILFVHASQWQTFTSQELHAWADGLRHWLRNRHCTLLILSHGNGVSRLRDQLGTAHQIPIPWRMQASTAGARETHLLGRGGGMVIPRGLCGNCRELEHVNCSNFYALPQ